MFVACFKKLFRNLPRGTEENHYTFQCMYNKTYFALHTTVHTSVVVRLPYLINVTN